MLWELITKHPPNQQMEPAAISELVELCMHTYFKFEGEVYEQLKGTPMGSPISGFIAEAVMQKLEKEVLPRIIPKLWLRYVDDTFVILKKSELERTHHH
ncbi:unnamed protein product [Echinostoma caproni]|uniref:Reverse transcriptase domain-containing protein n=1 Tax=Echinostoma caproni TaxID=27848 RepID=A0A183AAA5_9TREM|nr:unnamed protein product [Echinostoma caproni]